MKSLITYASFLSSAMALGLSKCDVEVAFVIDTSIWWKTDGETISRLTQEGVKEAERQLHSLRTAVATFVDKAAPEVGLGDFGGNLVDTGYEADWCWKLVQEPTMNASSTIAETLASLAVGYGLDPADGHLEAIAHAVRDPALKWTPGHRKMIFLVTDSAPHVGGDVRVDGDGRSAAEAVTRFNTPVECIDDGATTQGGFGALQGPEGLDSMQWWSVKSDDYNRYAQLMQKKLCFKNTTADEDAELETLEAVTLREASWPTMLPFDADVLVSDPVTHCAYHEYPSYEEVADLLNGSGIDLVVVVVSNRVDEPQVPEPRAGNEAAATWFSIMQGPLSNVYMEVVVVNEASLEGTWDILVDRYLEESVNPNYCGLDYDCRP